mgnify:CR=1 FL=1
MIWIQVIGKRIFGKYIIGETNYDSKIQGYPHHFGGSGRKYAEALSERLTKISIEERYPIRATIIISLRLTISTCAKSLN